MNVICFGDSNTWGFDPRGFLPGRYDPDSRWPDLLAAETGWKVRNQGMNGRTVPRDGMLLPEDADLLIVMLGTNDLLQGSAPAEISDRMENFLVGLTLARERILLIAPPPLVRGEWVPDQCLIEASMELAQYYQALAQRLGIRFLNAGAWRVSMAFDGVHFTEAGHRTFAASLGKELKDLCGSSFLQPRK